MTEGGVIKMQFDQKVPAVGQLVLVEIEASGTFIMEARVKCRYANPSSQYIVLDVPDTPSSSLPNEFAKMEGDKWRVENPQKCPFLGWKVLLQIVK